MRIRVLAAALLLAPLAASAAARAQSCTPQLVGADRRGPAHALARSGTMVYLGAGAALVVVDAADPLNPVERGYANLHGIVRDVASWGWTAIALVSDALEFVDATDPAHPYVVGSFPLPPEWQVQTIDARDTMVFFTAPDGLHIVSFENPAAPQEIGTFPIAEAADVVARTGRAYLLADRLLHVLDTGDPSAPAEIVTVAVPFEAADFVTLGLGGARLATWGSSGLIGHSWGDVAFFDLANPDLPVERSGLSFCCDDDPPKAVALAAGRAYVRHWGSVEIYDLSDLSDPVFEKRLWTETTGQLFGAPDPDYLLLTDDLRGLRVLDVAPPSAAHEVAAVETAGEALDGFFVGTLAVTTHSGGVRVYDVSEPERPALLGRSATTNSGLTQEVRRVGSHAYSQAYTWPSPVYSYAIFDLADSTAPVQVGSFGAGLGLYPLAVGRDLAIAASGTRAPLFDLSDPSQPFEVGELPTLGLWVFDAPIAGDRAYAWTIDDDQSERLWIFDVSQPAAPVALGIVEMPGLFGPGSAVFGSRLFACSGDEFAVYDVAEPAHVQQLGSLQLPWSHGYRRIALYGARAFLGPDYTPWPEPRIFRVLDLSDPTQPSEIAALLTMASANQVFAGPGLIGVADGEAGFALYESCVPFADGFESGDASAWSAVAP